MATFPNGFTVPGSIGALGVYLSNTVYGKLYRVDSDGTIKASSITVRSPMMFGAPDANGIYNLSAMASWGVFAVKESVAGIGLFTTLSAGFEFYRQPFEEAKNMYPGGTLDLSTFPLGLPVVENLE